MDEKKTREFINPHAFAARGMKNADGTPAPEDGRVYTIVGPVNNIQLARRRMVTRSFESGFRS